VPAGGCRFSWSVREVLGGEVQEGYEDEEEGEGGVEGAHGLRLLGAGRG